MKKTLSIFTTRILTLLALLAAATALNGAPMTNNDVIRMVKSGLDESVIITSIQNADSRFDTSADGIIALTGAQVSKPVINAMIARASAANTAAPVANNAAPAANTAYAPPPPQNTTAAAPQAPRAAGNDGDLNRLLLPNHPTFFLTVGPTYLYSSAAGDSSNGLSMYGGTLSFGWRINRHHKLQIDTCVAAGSKDNTDCTAVHGLVAYSFCIPFDEAGHAEFRLSPALGLAYNSSSYDHYYEYYNYYSGYYGYNVHYTSSDTAFAGGLGVGFTFHTGRHFLLDIGTRYLRIENTGGTNTVSLNFAIGWKF